MIKLKNIKPNPEDAIIDVSKLNNIELLDYVLQVTELKYNMMDISNRAKYSTCRDFYQGVGRGFWECRRVINEIKGRINKEDSNDVQSN